MSGYSKPVPVPDPISEPFWQGLREGEFRLQRCSNCSLHQFYPRSLCAHCGSMDLEWHRASGRGSVHTYTVIHRSNVPGWRDDVPYVVALVDLEEGPRVETNIVECGPDEVVVGAAVRLRPTAVTGDVTLPLFVLDR